MGAVRKPEKKKYASAMGRATKTRLREKNAMIASANREGIVAPLFLISSEILVNSRVPNRNAANTSHLERQCSGGGNIGVCPATETITCVLHDALHRQSEREMYSIYRINIVLLYYVQSVEPSYSIPPTFTVT